jgi:hypothetical protein
MATVAVIWDPIPQAGGGVVEGYPQDLSDGEGRELVPLPRHAPLYPRAGFTYRDRRAKPHRDATYDGRRLLGDPAR